jgi:hypothetical protein
MQFSLCGYLYGNAKTGSDIDRLIDGFAAATMQPTVIAADHQPGPMAMAPSYVAYPDSLVLSNAIQCPQFRGQPLLCGYSEVYAEASD